MKRTLIASLILMLSINIIYAGWTETFETAATPDGQGMIASDITCCLLYTSQSPRDRG